MVTFTDYELPLFRKYIEVQRSSNNRNSENKSTVQSFLEGLRYENFIPRFVTEKNKYFYYILVLLMFGLIGVYLRLKFDLDFSDILDPASP